MNTAHLPHIFVLTIILASGCNRTVTPQPETTTAGATEGAIDAASSPHLGLPALTGDDTCPDRPRQFNFDNWVSAPDALVIVTVDSLELNQDIVYQDGLPTTRLSDLSTCEDGGITPGILVHVSDVDVLRGSFSPAETSFLIGGNQMVNWVPQVGYDASSSNSLAWDDTGQMIGPGMRLGVPLYWSPTFQEWSARGFLFEVDPSGDVAFQKVNPQCVALSKGFTKRPLASFENAVNSASPDPQAVVDLRREEMPADSDLEAWTFLATLCITPASAGSMP